MKKAQLTVGTGIALFAFLGGIPFISDQNAAVGTILDIADFICYGTHAPSDAAGTGAADGGHQHAAPAGLYMPMFSTPPVGGAVYNGPPLDEC